MSISQVERFSHFKLEHFTSYNSHIRHSTFSIEQPTRPSFFEIMEFHVCRLLTLSVHGNGKIIPFRKPRTHYTSFNRISNLPKPPSKPWQMFDMLIQIF